MTQIEKLIGCVIRLCEDAPRHMQSKARSVTLTINIDSNNDILWWHYNQIAGEGEQKANEE